MRPGSITKAQTRRIFAAVLTIIGLVPFCVCLFRHTCMCGHLAHGTYSMRPLVNDAVWLLLLPVSAVVCLRSDMYGKTLLAAALSYLVATNLQIITGRWAWRLWAADLILLSLLVSFPIALLGVFRGRQSQMLSPWFRRLLCWPPHIRVLPTLSPMWKRVLTPMGWTLLILGFLSIACSTRYRSDGYFPIERQHHAAVTRGESYTHGDLHRALNGLSYDLKSHGKKRERWIMVAAWLMLAGGVCLAQSRRERKNGRSQPSPPAYPGGRADAPSGSAEA